MKTLIFFKIQFTVINISNLTYLRQSFLHKMKYWNVVYILFANLQLSLY